ncbi:MAG: cation transporter [Helicobacter sp.]|nr:cation transporter [Helicobacter sp.]
METNFKVNDISCQKCADKITNYVQNIEGVSSVKVDLATKNVQISHNTKEAVLKDALLDLGYQEIN